MQHKFRANQIVKIERIDSTSFDQKVHFYFWSHGYSFV